MKKVLKSCFMTGLIVGTVLVGCFTLTGCEREGPLEKAGEKTDKALEDVRDSVEDAGDRIEDATDGTN